MNTSIMNYPGFQTLPKGVRQMLLVSEAHFFDQPVSHRQPQTAPAQEPIALTITLTSAAVVRSFFQKLFRLRPRAFTTTVRILGGSDWKTLRVGATTA
jgi:hypothetical protein